MTSIVRIQNLPSILRGIASDEQIRSADDLQALNDAADEIELLNTRDTLRKYAIAHYLIDVISDPVERQRIAAQRFGKAIAKLTAEEAR